MNNKLSEFLGLIKVEFQSYKDLRNVLRQEQRALIQNNLNEINRILPLKEELLHRIKKVKTKQERLSSEIFKKKFSSFPDIIRELKTNVDLAAGEELDEMYAAAVSTISEVILLNSRNNMLLRQSLSITRTVMKKIAGAGAPGMYNRNGVEEGKAKNRNIINKQV